MQSAMVCTIGRHLLSDAPLPRQSGRGGYSCVPSKDGVLYGHRCGGEQRGCAVPTPDGNGGHVPRSKHDNARAVPVIAFFNQKGGTAKTTSTLNVGAALAERGHKTLAIDLDP